jgi:hypothetical protein
MMSTRTSAPCCVSSSSPISIRRPALRGEDLDHVGDLGRRHGEATPLDGPLQPGDALEREGQGGLAALDTTGLARPRLPRGRLCDGRLLPTSYIEKSMV